jgi:hypothetical protein
MAFSPRCFNIFGHIAEDVDADVLGLEELRRGAVNGLAVERHAPRIDGVVVDDPRMAGRDVWARLSVPENCAVSRFSDSANGVGAAIDVAMYLPNREWLVNN